MKTTRKIFLFTGNKEVVRNILDVVSGFKAIEVVEKLLPSQKDSIFACNKNIACTSTIECQADYEIKCYYSTGKVITEDFAINASQNVIMQIMQIANSIGVDIGDHRSNATVTQEVITTDCLFCKLIAGNPIHRQDTIYESRSFIVIPGSGAFIPGYLALLPKRHVMSIGELTENERVEFQEVIEDIKYILESIYNQKTLIWENGSGAGGVGKDKSSIVHAHVHACPSSIDIISTTELNGITLKEIEYSNLPEYKKESYLLVHTENRWYIRPSENVYVPRQYIRQLLASDETTGILEVWNWRINPFWDDVQKCSDLILKWLKDNWEGISSRIKERTGKYV